MCKFILCASYNTIGVNVEEKLPKTVLISFVNTYVCDEIINTYSR